MPIHIEVKISQLTGRKHGVVSTEPLDVIWEKHGGKAWRKIGVVARANNATVLFIRFLDCELRGHVRGEVERLRLETTGYTIAEGSASVPSPALVEAYHRGELKKPAKTTIVRPDGELFDQSGDEEPEEDDDDE
jgi:hypothetical protein